MIRLNTNITYIHYCLTILLKLFTFLVCLVSSGSAFHATTPL